MKMNIVIGILLVLGSLSAHALEANLPSPENCQALLQSRCAILSGINPKIEALIDGIDEREDWSYTDTSSLRQQYNQITTDIPNLRPVRDRNHFRLCNAETGNPAANLMLHNMSFMAIRANNTRLNPSLDDHYFNMIERNKDELLANLRSAKSVFERLQVV